MAKISGFVKGEKNLPAVISIVAAPHNVVVRSQDSMKCHFENQTHRAAIKVPTLPKMGFQEPLSAFNCRHSARGFPCKRDRVLEKKSVFQTQADKWLNKSNAKW